MNENVAKLVSETDVVTDLKRRFAEGLQPVLALAREANSHKIDVNLMFSRNQFGELQLEAKLVKFL
jgi:hypothetical protein